MLIMWWLLLYASDTLVTTGDDQVGELVNIRIPLLIFAALISSSVFVLSSTLLLRSSTAWRHQKPPRSPRRTWPSPSRENSSSTVRTAPMGQIASTCLLNTHLLSSPSEKKFLLAPTVRHLPSVQCPPLSSSLNLPSSHMLPLLPPSRRPPISCETSQTRQLLYPRSGLPPIQKAPTPQKQPSHRPGRNNTPNIKNAHCIPIGSRRPFSRTTPFS